MQNRIVSLLGASLILLAACSGGTPADEVLPTLAQLPTALPTATRDAATATTLSASPVFTDAPTQTPVSTALESNTLTEATVPADESTATFLPIPDSSQPSIFPTLALSQDIILQGQMTIIDDTHATLTDSEGHTAVVLIDPFAAQIGANQLVQISGVVETEGDQLVLRMTAITILSESTAEPSSSDAIIPSPTAS